MTRTVEANADAVSDLAEEIGSGKYVAAAVVARGSSRNACEYFKYALERYTGMPVLFIEPSVTAVYGGKLALKNFLLFAVSQSGKAEDISSVVRAAKESGAKVVAVTNNPDSPLGYGVIFGDERALSFLRAASIALEPGDRVIFTSDGIDQYLYYAPIGELAALSPDELLDRSVRYAEAPYNRYADDKAVVVVDVQ